MTMLRKYVENVKHILFIFNSKKDLMKCSNYILFLIHSFMIIACNRKITDIKKGLRKMSLII